MANKKYNYEGPCKCKEARRAYHVAFLEKHNNDITCDCGMIIKKISYKKHLTRNIHLIELQKLTQINSN